ncbi:hypothetical protein [Streptomyces wuyuanensis]
MVLEGAITTAAVTGSPPAADTAREAAGLLPAAAIDRDAKRPG